MGPWFIGSLLLCAGLTAGCRSTENRPVVEHGDAAQLWALWRRPVVASQGVQALEVLVRAGGVVVAEVARSLEAAVPGSADPRVGAFDVAGDPGPALVDLGLPVLVDFGVGEAPYDDCTAPLHPGALSSGGFSGSVLSLVWRRPLPLGLVLQGQAALVRDQDLSLLDGLGEARFGFAVLGLSVSF